MYLNNFIKYLFVCRYEVNMFIFVISDVLKIDFFFVFFVINFFYFDRFFLDKICWFLGVFVCYLGILDNL